MTSLGIVNNEVNRSLTGLGTVPNDDELAHNVCYTPVHSGWVYGRRANGSLYHQSGLYGPAVLLAADPSTPPDAVKELVSIQRKQMLFQGITTAAIATLALTTIGGLIFGKKQCK